MLNKVVRDLIRECRKRGGCLRKDNGVWQINRTPWERVNVYTRIGQTPPHSHAHSFTSYVVHGNMENYRYRAVDSVEGAFRYSVDRSGDAVVFAPVFGRTELEMVGKDLLTPGVVYHMPREVVHIADIKEPSITYIIRTEHEPAPQLVYTWVQFTPAECRRLVKPQVEDWSEIDSLLDEAMLL